MENNTTLVVKSPNTKYTDDHIFADYEFEETLVTKNGNEIVAKPYRKSLSIRTERKVGKVGVMLVGWGGNNGSTFTAAVLANRHQLSWTTKNGQMDSNWFGSITQASTVRLGIDEKGQDVYMPMSQLLPMVHPDDLFIDGWDISPLNLAESMARAKVIDYDLQQKLKKEMATMKPRPAIYDPDFIAANQAKPYRKSLSIRTERKVGKVGVMLVGWGGNNGSTFTAAVLANRHQLSWTTKNGQMDSNWFGSITQASTVRLGIDEKGQDVYMPMSQLLPMVHPDDLFIDGWDISPLNLAESMARAKVIDYDLQQKLKKEMATMKPRPAIYDPDFIAANQADRATNLIRGTKQEQYLQLRADIKDFRDKKKLDKVYVLWTANTERFCEVRPGVHDTSENLERALRNNDSEVSPSTIFALAAIDEGCCYINGSPQNTIVPGVVERAESAGVFVAGDDFKSGQTKLKSVLVDFLVSAGLKPVSIVSYNHLGNNDGKNLSAPKQFRSKEISKSNVVDDMVESNSILYKPGEKPDHVVVIKYVPYVGDSKRALDEYTSEILLHGTNTIVVHNTCEDSLLAVPLILDLVVLAELFSRVYFRAEGSQEWTRMHSVLSPLSYLLKAPLVPAKAPVINALFKQRACIDNLLRACLGLAADTHTQLEHKVPFLMSELHSGRMFSGAPPNKKQKVSSANGDR